MGMFSFKTNDTDRSIPIESMSDVPTFTVYMLDNKGRVWIENDYQGYGDFGGKDFYALLAQMNPLIAVGEGNPITGDDEIDRHAGIEMFFSPHIAILSPNLNEHPGQAWEKSAPDSCPHQGWIEEDVL